MGFDIVEFVKNQQPMFCEALSDSSVAWSKECQFAIQAFQKGGKLLEAAINNPASAQNALINIAAIGITINPASKLAYLVPRDGMVCLDISYMGLLHLAQTTGAIFWGQCKLVYENDTYESNGLDHAPTHKYNAFGDRGPVVGGYCTVKTADGDYLTEEMSLAEIKQIESTSKSKNGPWKTFFDEMARKTIVKRASKYWPSKERLDNAINILNSDGGEGLSSITDEPDISPATSETIAAINNQLLKIGKTWDADLLPLCTKVFKRSIKSTEQITEPEAIKVLNFLVKKSEKVVV